MKRHLSYFAFMLCLLALPVAARARDFGDVTSYFRHVEVGPGDTAQDVVCIYCSIRAAGHVTMDLVAIGGDIEILGKVDGDAVAVGGGVKLGPGAEVTGDAVALGGAVEVSAQAKVGGDRAAHPWFYVPGQRGLHARGALAFVGVCLAVAVVLALILRSARLENIAAAFRKRPGWTIAMGVVVFTLWIAILELADKLGRREDWVADPAILLCGAVYAAGYAGLSFGLGAGILPTRPTALRVLAGSLLLALPQLVPLLGLAVFLAVGVLALGAPVVSAFGASPEWLPGLLRRRKKLAETVNEGAK